MFPLHIWALAGSELCLAAQLRDQFTLLQDAHITPSQVSEDSFQLTTAWVEEDSTLYKSWLLKGVREERKDVILNLRGTHTIEPSPAPGWFADWWQELQMEKVGGS